jgi:hypothetical protein
METITTRFACRSDLPGIVRVHRLSFQNFLMSLLGPKFLYEYYSTVLDYHKSIALVAVTSKDSDPLGFVVGFVNPSSFYSLLNERKFLLMISACKHLSFRVHLWPRVYRSYCRSETFAQFSHR